MILKRKWLLVGAGAAGSAMARALAAARTPARWIWSRRATNAKALAQTLRAQALADPVQAADASWILVAVSDRAIGEVASHLARSLGKGLGRVALHTSGVAGPGALDPLRRAGWRTGVLHPATSLAVDAGAADFRGAVFGVGGDAGAVAHASRIARALRGIPVRVRSGEWPLYHAAASVASNALPGILDLSLAMFRSAGLPREIALRAAGALAFSALANAIATARTGVRPALALTGPVRRGDVATVRAHLAAIAARSALVPSRADYVAVQRLALRAAAADGLTAAQARAFRRLLG